MSGFWKWDSCESEQNSVNESEPDSGQARICMRARFRTGLYMYEGLLAGGVAASAFGWGKVCRFFSFWGNICWWFGHIYTTCAGRI